ncbi:hypothetical protein PVK06_040108 [Gossypium arboreum]|uniref:Uncharacterized protein n=1 Tax=Gossypium arboreum TaxID=29729 RepID=A0ABR0N4M4_GOSAR|nr:hypothetical protein PVK06_040108 [Gossypium arboreum]
MSVFKRESEFDKEASENEEREQEKARSVSTNRTTSSPCIASSFQVSEELINKFHLHYLPKERRFALVGKGNLSPPMPQGKEGKCYKVFQSPPTYLNVCDYIDDMANCHSLINGDVFILNDGKESITHENCGVEEHVGEVRSTHAFDPGIDSYAQLVNIISACPFEFTNHGDTIIYHFCEGDTLKSENCFCVYSSFQVSQGSCEELWLQYLSKERRFTLDEKGKTNFHLPSPNGKQGEFSLVLRPLYSTRIDDFVHDSHPEKVPSIDAVNCYSLIDEALPWKTFRPFACENGVLNTFAYMNHICFDTIMLRQFVCSKNLLTNYGYIPFT